MAKLRRITAYKFPYDSDNNSIVGEDFKKVPFYRAVTPRVGNVCVFYAFIDGEDVATNHGPMVSVHIRQNYDLANPDVDVAMLVGKLELRLKSGALNPLAPDVYYWRNKFWIKALNKDGVEYYDKKKSALYEIEIGNGAEILTNMVIDERFN